MTDVLAKKKTLTNQSSLKVNKIQKVNHEGDSIFLIYIFSDLEARTLELPLIDRRMSFFIILPDYLGKTKQELQYSQKHLVYTF